MPSLWVNIYVEEKAPVGGLQTKGGRLRGGVNEQSLASDFEKQDCEKGRGQYSTVGEGGRGEG
jgi:hypothetical protein